MNKIGGIFMMQQKRGNETTIKEVFMRNIGVSSLEEVNDWFRKSYANNYRLSGDDEFINIANQFKDKKIRFVGDYDGDGVGATSILMMGFSNAGFTNISYRIPTRQEGFGISMKIVDECIADGVELIITADNGIAGIEPIRKAKEHGITVIVTDHHQPQTDENGNTVLPDADLIINPNAVDNSADFNGYCGAGLVYKLMKKMNADDIEFCKKIQSIAAISTITDVMVLREENFVIVRNGLKRLTIQKYVSTGLYALISALNLTDHIDASDIGFKLGPCINACERIITGGAAKVVDLILFNGPYEEAVPMAQEIVEINKIRKDQTAKGYRMALDVIMTNGYKKDVPLVVYIPEINEGIIGILAGQLCEEFKVPVIVFTESSNPDIVKGSARSCGNCNIIQELEKISELLYKFGGHEAAAGLSAYKKNLSAIRDSLKRNLKYFVPETKDISYYDLEIEEKDIKDSLEELDKYRPFGNGNAEPVFKVSNFVLVPNFGSFSRILGENRNTVKISSKHADAIGFKQMVSQIGELKESKTFDLYGSLSYNYYRGKKYNQVEFSDFSEKKKTLVKTDLASKLQQMAASKE